MKKASTLTKPFNKIIEELVTKLSDETNNLNAYKNELHRIENQLTEANELIELLKRNNSPLSKWINDASWKLDDIGNEIGMVIGKFVKENPDYDLFDFIEGIKHGASLVNGTH